MIKQITIGKSKWFVYVNVTKWRLSLWIHKVLKKNRGYIPFALIVGGGPAFRSFSYEIGIEVCINKTIKEGDLMNDVKSFGFMYRLPINFKK